MALTQREKQVLRDLAQKYMEYASLPVQKERIRLWMALNDGAMAKPMFTIDQIPWHEMDVDGSLVCEVEDPYWKRVERSLRQEIYKWEHCPADMVLLPYLLIPHIYRNTSYGMTVEEERAVVDKKNDITGHYYKTQIFGMEDVEKIKTPVVTPCPAEEAEAAAIADELFAGIAPWKFRGTILHLGFWDFLSQWVGVENCYFNLIDEPELLHALMRRLTDATIEMIRQMNEYELFDTQSFTCHCTYTFSDKTPGGKSVSQNAWAFGMAQIFSSVSPDVTAEFEVPYMQEVYAHMGSVYYGCCEKLDDRLDVVSRMPNIRKVSCSPWSDREHFAATLPKQYVMSAKPNPAFLAGEQFDEELIRQDLRCTISAAREHGLGLELLLKDLSTVHYKPERIWRWSEIAAEETARG